MKRYLGKLPHLPFYCPLPPTSNCHTPNKQQHGNLPNQSTQGVLPLEPWTTKRSISNMTQDSLEYISLKRWRWFLEESRHKSGHDLTHFEKVLITPHSQLKLYKHHLHVSLLPNLWEPYELNTLCEGKCVASLSWLFKFLFDHKGNLLRDLMML